MEPARPALPQRFCANHPGRPAIGVCVVMSVAICGECSTRYEGVNYSKEGLRRLREQRAAAGQSKRPIGERMLAVTAWATTPVWIYLVYLGYAQTAGLLVDLLHWGR